MSRIGRKAIVLPKGTSVTIKGDKVVVKGTKGELNTPLMPGIAVDVSDDRVVVSRSNDEKPPTHLYIQMLSVSLLFPHLFLQAIPPYHL